ncbi:MAG TPA: RluA family pseudouridine synthase [Myxococcales bacterium]|nr:RluA family pseudouridine synthase [Myxococcales bacterium]
MRVLYRDESVLAVDKPAGVVTIPGRGEEKGEALSNQVREIANGALPVHRLDRDTSGVVLFALTRDAHRALNQTFESRRAEKRYFALVRGDLAVPARCELALVEGRRGTMRVAGAGNARAQRARTDVAPVDRFGGATWCSCRPLTGRTHQVRVHLAALGHPLLVDPRYGVSHPVLRRDLHAGATNPEAVALARTPLHAALVRLPHPTRRGFLQVEAPLPEDLSTCLDLLRAARREAAISRDRAPASSRLP